MADIIQIRRDTSGQWTTINPTLAQGELGMELDTLLFKVGNSVDPWNLLPYLWNSPGGIKIVFNGDGFYDIPVGYMLSEFIIVPGGDTVVRVGSTAGGDEYFFDASITSVEGRPYFIQLYSKTTAKRVYFTGLTSSSYVIFFLKFVKS